MRAILRVACVLVLVGSSAAAEDPDPPKLRCGKNFVTFPLAVNSGVRLLTVRKADIINVDHAIFGYINVLGVSNDLKRRMIQRFGIAPLEHGAYEFIVECLD